MTALDKYTRLEAIGQWREAPDDIPTEVVVSFGDATLVLSDLDENPLCHWAMAATNRISLIGKHAVYTPDTEGFETLEISAPEMIEAISQVSSAGSETPQKKRRVFGVFIIFLLALVGGIVYAAPVLLQAQANRMTSPASARKLGMDMFHALDLKLCHEARADIAKSLFENRAFPKTDIELLIVKDEAAEHVFPGHVIVLGNDRLRGISSPEMLASLINTIMFEKSSLDAIKNLFSDSNPGELFDYVTTGALPVERILAAADKIMEESPSTEIPASITFDRQILRDQDWVALQGICLD